jgi:hypothetical protein
MAKDLLHGPRVIDHGEDPHGAMADGVVWLIMLHLE